MLSAAHALYGAAYQVIFERVNNPDRATTKEALAEVLGIIEKIKAWAMTQSPEIRVAYDRAAQDVAKRAADVLENNERRRLMIAARQTLPTPP